VLTGAPDNGVGVRCSRILDRRVIAVRLSPVRGRHYCQDTFFANVRLVVFLVPSAVCFCGFSIARWNRHLRGQFCVCDDCSNRSRPVPAIFSFVYRRANQRASLTKSVIVNRDRHRWLTDSSTGFGVRHTWEHGRVGITTQMPDRPKYVPLYLLKILYLIYMICFDILLQRVWSICDFIVNFRFIIFIINFFVNITVAFLARLSRHFLSFH
jgi:hypothetical protein